MSSLLPTELRQLKRPKLGPPGYYPQDPRQEEDELTTVNVKQGFLNGPPNSVSNEYGTGKNCNIYKNKFGVYFSNIVAEKQKLNTFQDTSRKRQPISKDNFFLVSANKSKGQVQSWFHDLAGNKSLNQLTKKVPVFHRKEDIFVTLCESNMPMIRAAWYLKMMAANQAAISETKMKKRQPNDPSQDWCLIITKFLKGQLDKIVEYNNTASLVSAQQAAAAATKQSSSTGSSMLGGGMGSMGMGAGAMGGSTIELEKCVKLWQYTTELARYLYQEGMLECHDYLSWLVDTLEKVNTNDDSTLRFLLPFVVQYLEEFLKSQMLSRRLAYVCARRLTSMCSEPRPNSPHLNTSSNTQMPPNTQSHSQHALASILAEFRSCPQHHSIILGLSCILQAVTLRCPSALVWINLGESKNYSVPGSPLDILPCPPSLLPLPGSVSMQNHQIRSSIRLAENQIKMRSRRAEVRWSSDKCQESAAGHTISRVLQTLEVLDRHCFDRCDASNSIDALYNKIFLGNQKQEAPEPLQNDDPIVLLLCQWAVCPERTSEHRALVVAQLLEKYVIDMEAEKLAETEGMEDKEMAPISPMPTASTIPVFQNLLQHFLDVRAPVIDDNSSADDKKAFANLVLLFGELIRCDVFSHDAYMCTLISRGDLTTTQAPQTGGYAGGPGSQRNDRGAGDKSEAKDVGEEKQDSSDNEEYDYLDDKPPPAPAPPPRKESASFQEKFLESIQSKSDSQSDISDDEKDSPMDGDKSDEEKKSDIDYRSPSPESPPVNRHQLYVKHFPISLEDGAAYHESNQRSVLLYGFGRARTEARQQVKHVQKDLLKILTQGGGKGEASKGKKVSKSDEPTVNQEETMQRFLALCYFDEHMVTGSCANGVLDQVQAFSMANRDTPPTFDQVTLVFELLENALNINGLLEFAVKMLSHMSRVEHELMRRKSAQGGTYCTNLCLTIVAVLRRFQACLLVFPEQTATVFELLCGVVKHVSNVTNCTSAERCILAYLYDLYTSCSHLKSKFSDLFSSVANKVKQALYTSITPSESNSRWNQDFMQEYIDNPRGREFKQSSLGRQLNDNPGDRYSFVCNALLAICNADPEKLNNLSIMCAELTASCTTLSSEWLGVLKALCCSSIHSCGFNDLLCTVDVSDLSIHDNIAVFTAILIARHCFSLEDVVDHVALASLIAANPGISGASIADPDAEPGARLMCHLLLCLFCTSQDTACATPTLPPSGSSSNNGGNNPTNATNPTQGDGGAGGRGGGGAVKFIKTTCDRHMLDSAHSSITVDALVGVLKAILLLGDAAIGGGSSSSLFGSFDDFGGSGSGREGGREGGSQDEGFNQGGKSSGNMSTASLSNYAKYTLKTICSQNWVRETFLKDQENLWTNEVLLDQYLTHKQIHYLLQLICYPSGTSTIGDGGSDSDQKTIITRILKNLNQWTLRVSWLELQLMLKQCPSASENNSLLENIAKATIEVFQLTPDDDQSSSKGGSNSGSRRSSGANHKGTHDSKSDPANSSVWLVAPLISKLPSSVQGRVLKQAGNILESVGQTWTSKPSSKDKDKQGQRSQASTVSHQPLLSLVLTCLKGQDEQREGLLTSLQTQLTQFLQSPKDDRWEDPKSRRLMHEALQLRLSLVGNMFDTIMRSSLTWTTEFALLLLQLITTGTVDPHTNNELFTTVLDMLSVLINSTLSSDASGSPGAGEEKGRSHQALIKKLKKEVGDKHSDGINLVRQLLPVPRKTIEVITCEPMGSLIDTKGNKITGFDSIDKKQGLQVSAKQKINPWDTLEILKNPAPLSWAWFGGIRMERKPLRYQEQYRLTLYHSHNQVKPDSHYFDPPQVPPDEEEPPPPPNQEAEKPVQEMNTSQSEIKVGVVIPVEGSKETTNKKGKKRTNRKRPANTPAQAPMREPYQFGSGMSGYPERNFVPSAMLPQGQVPFQQPLPPAGPIRPERPHIMPGSSKMVLKNHLIGARTAGPAGQSQRDDGYGYGSNILKPLLTQKLLRDQIARRRGPGGISQDNQMTGMVQPGNQYGNYNMTMMGQQTSGMSSDPHAGQPASSMVGSGGYNQQFSHPTQQGGNQPQRLMPGMNQQSGPNQMGYPQQHQPMHATRARLQHQIHQNRQMHQGMQQPQQHPTGPAGQGAYMSHQMIPQEQQQQQQRGQQQLLQQQQQQQQQQRMMALRQQQMQGQVPMSGSGMMPGMQGQMGGGPGRPAGNNMNQGRHNTYTHY